MENKTNTPVENKEMTWEQLVKKHTIETSSKFTVDVRGICDEYAAIKVLKHQPKWISVDERFPKHLETVWLANDKGWVSLGCLVDTDDGWHWAEHNGAPVYLENGKIVAECDSDDLEVTKWHPLPNLQPIHRNLKNQIAWKNY